MNKRLSVSVIVHAFILVNFLTAQTNPFFPGAEPAERTATASPGFLGGLPACINEVQRGLNESLSVLSRRVNEEKSIVVYFVLIAVAVGYGIVHALGPGHGKIIMVSYALANPLRATHGIALGVVIAIIHTLSSVVLVSLLYMILRSSYAAYAGGPKRIVSLVSYGLVALMGFLLLVSAIAKAFASKRNNGGLPAMSDYREKRMKDLIFPALLMGIVPCEGAILILVFSISIGAYWLGIILAAAMSIGMAITISAVGLIAVYSRRGATGLVTGNRPVLDIVALCFRFAGSAVIAAFGTILFVSNL